MSIHLLRNVGGCEWRWQRLSIERYFSTKKNSRAARPSYLNELEAIDRAMNISHPESQPRTALSARLAASQSESDDAIPPKAPCPASVVSAAEST